MNRATLWICLWNWRIEQTFNEISDDSDADYTPETGRNSRSSARIRELPQRKARKAAEEEQKAKVTKPRTRNRKVVIKEEPEDPEEIEFSA